MVSFSDIEYHTALEQGKKQDEEMKKFIKHHDISWSTDDKTLDEIIHNTLGKEILA
jgi:hypothetical protein